MNNECRAILLRLPKNTISRLDLVVDELRMPSRASLVRRAIYRQLDYSEQYELPLVRFAAVQKALEPSREVA